MKEVSCVISIVVPVYNVEEYLDRCVSSLVRQDYPYLEILLIDDGSTDSSSAMCDRWAERDNRITAFHKPNGGLSDARNFGLEKAGGKYVLFVDSDDYLTDRACSCLVKDAEDNSADVVTGHAVLLRNSPFTELMEQGIRDHFEYHKPYAGKYYLQKCLETTDLRVEAWRSLYRREFLKRNDLKFCFGIAHEDEEFTPRMLLAAERIVLNDCAFYIYDNTRANSIMNSQKLNPKKAKDKIFIFERLSRIYEEVSPRKLKRLLQDNLCWKYLDCVWTYDLAGDAGFRPEKLKMLKYAYKPKRRIKAVIFAVSPKLFCRVMHKV